MLIEINGLKINFIDEGEGQPILLLHGWGSSIAVWTRMITYLKAKGGFRIVALDFPGCGKSPEPDHPLNINDYSELVLEFCRQQQIEKPILFGHSNGGRVTLTLLGQDLLQAEKIVLFGSAGIKQKRKPLKTLKIAAFKTAKFFLTLPILKHYTADHLDRVRAYFGSADYNNASLVMRQTLVSLVNYDVTPLLPNVKVPTLLIWGSNDTAAPLADAKVMEKKIPDAGLCVLEGCSHFALIERPYEVEAILDHFI